MFQEKRKRARLAYRLSNCPDRISEYGVRPYPVWDGEKLIRIHYPNHYNIKKKRLMKRHRNKRIRQAKSVPSGMAYRKYGENWWHYW